MAAARRRTQPTFPCPHCGDDVPEGARACPHCGSDENTGWSPDTMYDDLDLPDEGYGRPQASPRQRSPRLWQAVALMLLIIFFFMIWLTGRI
jgi:uncharacterized membrane protein YvbJ